MTVGYLCAIGVSVLFMLYLDGAVGVMMLAFLLLMPVLSLLLTFLVRGRISLRMELPDSVAKYREFSAKIILEKRTPLPIPFLRVVLQTDGILCPLNPLAPQETAGKKGRAGMRGRGIWRKSSAYGKRCLTLCLSMGFERKREYHIRLKAQYCGSTTLKLKPPYLSDYLGMFSIRAGKETEGEVLCEAEIPDMKATSTLFLNVTSQASSADEESESTPQFSASSVPGYEHRNYIPGDPLKRINWKLSSKRRQLMVRMDEPAAMARIAVIVDRCYEADLGDDEEHPYAIQEQLLETALGFLNLCAQNGYPCDLSYQDWTRHWMTLPIESGEQLAVEAVNLLRGGFHPKEFYASLPVFPQELAGDHSKVILYFTADFQKEKLAALEQVPQSLYLVVPEELAGRFSAPKNGSLWKTTDERLLIPVSLTA